MTAAFEGLTTAIELAYCQQTVLRTVGVLVAVLLPAGSRTATSTPTVRRTVC